MRWTRGTVLAALSLLLLWTAGAAPQEESASAGTSSDVERGRYIVEQVSLCVQCHTPRAADGELDRSRWLQGAEVPVTAPSWGRNWAFMAPSLVGMLGYTEEQAVTLLSEGDARDGKPPIGPMPPFRMSEEDARAVFAYLTSLR